MSLDDMRREQERTLNLQGYIRGEDGIWRGKHYWARQTDEPGLRGYLIIEYFVGTETR